MDSPTFTILIAAAGLASGVVLCWLLMRGRSSAAPTPLARPDAHAELAQANGRIRKLEEERQAAVKNYNDLKHQTARSRDLPDLRKKDDVPPPELTAQLTSLQAQLTALQAQEVATRADAARAKSEALAEQTQAKEYFRSLEKNQQLAAASAQTLKVEADGLRAALDQAARQAAQIPALQAQLAVLQNKEQLNQQAALRGAQGHEESAESLKRAQARVAALEQENAMLKRNAAAFSASSSAPQARPAAVSAQATQLPVLEEQVVALQDLEKAIKKEFQLLAELQRNVTLTSATRHEFIDSPESKTGASSASAA